MYSQIHALAFYSLVCARPKIRTGQFLGTWSGRGSSCVGLPMRQSRLGSGCAGWLPFLLLGWLHWDGVWAEQSAGLCRVVVCLQPLGSVGVDQTEEYMVWSRFGPFRIKKICEETVSRSDLDKKNFRLWPKKSSLDPRLYSNCTIARFSQ